MKFVNLTPHAITIELGTKAITIEPSGKTARVDMNQEWLEQRLLSDAQVEIRVPCFTQIPGDVTDLPEPAPETLYLVSNLVRAAVPERADVFSPDTGPSANRNDKGQIVSVRALIGNAAASYLGNTDE